MMDVTGKIRKIRRLGLYKSVKMVAVKWKKHEQGLGFSVTPVRKLIVDKIFQNRYKRIIIFENHFGYYNIMMQRPQHLLKNMGDKDTLVFYNSYYDVDYNNRNRITKITSSVYVLDLYYYRKYLFESLQYISQKYLCVYSTDTVPIRRIEDYLKKGFHIIYEYVDDINSDLINPKNIIQIKNRHNKLLQQKDVLTVATADKLYKNAKNICEDARILQLSNGAECARFSPSVVTKDKEYLNWIRSDKIKIGYYGALASWIDYELLKYLAVDNRLQIILIGVEHDDSLNCSGLLNCENVKYFGKKPYEELAGYVHFFDVCIIPFLINEITAATSPVKLFEYMSMEKPIVTTALPECMKYNVINIAHSKEEFSNLIHKSWTEQNNNTKEKLRQCAWDNDWSAKASVLKQYLSQWEKDER